MFDRFMGYRWRTWWKGGIRVWTLAAEENIGLIAAGVAFWGMLAMFPAFAAVVAIFGLVSDPVYVAQQMELLRGLVPEDAFKLLNDQVRTLTGAGTQTLGFATFLSLAIALWSSRLGTAALIQGLNQINRQPNRMGLRHYLTAVTLTLCLVALAIVAIFAIVVTPIALRFLPLGAFSTNAIEVARWLLALWVLVMGISLLYRFGPNRRGQRMAWLTPGAFVTVAAWAAASAAFNLYLSNFGRYNEIYGSIGAVIALLMWLYISAYLVLLGAALNVTLEDTRRLQAAKADD